MIPERDWLRALNPAQRDAVEHVDGPILVVNREIAREAEPIRLPSKQSGRKRVKRADPQPGRVALEECRDPVLPGLVVRIFFVGHAGQLRVGFFQVFSERRQLRLEFRRGKLDHRRRVIADVYCVRK